MIVKIGKTLYDSTKHPILLILGNEEKIQIGNMSNKKFCSFPDGSDLAEIKEFMQVSDETLKMVDYDETINYGEINKATK